MNESEIKVWQERGGGGASRKLTIILSCKSQYFHTYSGKMSKLVIGF